MRLIYVMSDSPWGTIVAEQLDTAKSQLIGQMQAITI